MIRITFRKAVTMISYRFLIFAFLFAFSTVKSAIGAEGVFVDSPVSGLHYETGTHQGYTNVPGEFQYEEGETVRFYIGSLFVGESIGKPMISPIDLVPGAVDETHPTVTNICRLLQSLDRDLNLGNGISIEYNAGVEIEGREINFDQSIVVFENDPEVTGYFDALNARGYFDGGTRDGALISARLAQLHLRATLMNWDKQTYPWDSDLEPGFPTGALDYAGTYHAGPIISCLIGNVDDDPELEIFFSGIGAGPLYGIKHDGSLLKIYGSTSGVAYPALGRLQDQTAPLSVVSGTILGDFIEAYEGNGTALPGWPIAHANYISAPPSTADVDNDGRDEIFINEEDGCIHAYRANGSILPGWPVCQPVDPNWSQKFTTPAIGNLDDDDQIEIVAVSYTGMLYAIHADGMLVDGFPIKIPAHVDSYPVIGDVDQDGDYEIVVGGYSDFSYDDSGEAILIVSNSGTIENRIDLSYHDVEYGAAPALADLDADGHPEIIYQTRAFLFVFRYEANNFRAMEGWPQRLSKIANPSAGWSSPVVGDIDGDGIQEIVVTVNSAIYVGQCVDEVRAYEINGYLQQRFPKVGCFGRGGTPAIADIDKDERNEIIVRGNDLDYDPLIYVYDLGGNQAGMIEWGQYGRDSKHSNFYPLNASPEPDADGDGLSVMLEVELGTYANDADTDDDGISDGDEDQNKNGVVDPDETDPVNPDTDGDGIQDGTESGVSLDQVGPDTDLAVFIPDLDPTTTTNPLLTDTDGDGISDGDEDLNKNGRVDAGEGDPNIQDAKAKSKAMPWVPLLLLD